jgi:glyoxylase I family protein
VGQQQVDSRPPAESGGIATTAHHLGLVCRDPAATEQWYTRHFGFRRARVVPLGGSDQIVFLKSGSLYLELFKATQTSPAPAPAGPGPEYPGWRHLAFKVDDVDAKVAEMGGDARITAGPMSFDDFIPGWRTVWVADPDGNIVEISQGYVDQDDPPPG